MISVSSRLSRTSAFSSVGQRTHGALSEARGRRAARPRTVAEELRTLRVAGESAPLAAHQVLEVDGAGLPDARIERCAAPARWSGWSAFGMNRTLWCATGSARALTGSAGAGGGLATPYLPQPAG